MPENNTNDRTITLVDSSTTLDDIEKILEKNSKIISFDFVSHKKLAAKNIKHEISDYLLNQTDLEEIQNKAHILSKWAESTPIKQFFDYHGFNLGNFFYQEIFIYLIPLLKKLVEVQKISKKYQHSKFICSGILKKIIELLNMPCKTINETNNVLNEFHYDYIKFQNNLLGLKISRAKYLKLKKLLEKNLNIFFGPKKNFGNGILLVEFNTNQYSSLFLKLNENNLRPIFYGRKRPAIWNKNSLFIIKKSKSVIVTEGVLTDKEFENIISADTNKILPKILETLEGNNFFEDFFSINNTSFWKIMKPSFLDLNKRRIKEAIREINLAKRLLKKFKPKSIIVLSESGYTEQYIIFQAKKTGIPVILLQHGVGGSDGPQSNIINEFTGSMPIISDEFFIWGKALEKYSKAFGIDEKKIRILGSPAHDKVFERLRIKPKLKEDFILVSMGSATHNHVNDYTVKANQDDEDALRIICNAVTKAKKKLIIKIHPYTDDIFAKEIAKEIEPTIKIIKKGDISSLIESCELMIILAITSAILDAQIYEKPVIRIPLREWWGPPDTHRTSPGLNVQVKDFEKTFNKILNDHKFPQEVIEIGKRFVNDNLTNQGHAAQSISELLNT